ncbi:FAD/NAD(P)-binding protein [Kocuria sp. p3-SID1433]|uniref:FAD/NAD(P)-binding protein n=1 Tax=unclassified Kocuria TaxID=2649579 RepID=UPI0021A4F3ED|nr:MULTISPECIES: FAD/NAD(P)-binding protein [unclassified Kocuria]MCT1601350.1 FAD/NAD(P)-binding protein [Kocuria sp. p3-SID1428]MCT2180183.1 FAD/NAD(P)-binding protein [Kocuria sp. p3-SID1433]
MTPPMHPTETPHDEPRSRPVPRVVIVGCGPRGLSALERLIARSAHSGRRVNIDVVDPFPPGAGHVWRTRQSPRFLMNTPSLFPTVIAADGALDVPPLEPLRGMSFDGWRRAVVEQGLPVELDEQNREALQQLGAADFPQRRLYGAYLEWVFRTLVESAPATVELRVHRDEAVAARRVESGRHSYAVEIGGQQELLADHVVLALGHLDAHLSRRQKELVDGAAQNGLDYRPPIVPADGHWDTLPAGETVLVRGMGLNFHDVLAEVTEGRGGVFEPADDGTDRLVYRPSGQEPFVVAGSRRGTPYRAKPEIGSYYARSLEHRFLTPETIEQLRGQGPLSFERVLLPLVLRDAHRTYYRTYARVHADRLGMPAADFLVELDRALGVPDDDAPSGPARTAPAARRGAEREWAQDSQERLAEDTAEGLPWEVRLERLVQTAVPAPDRFDPVRSAKPFRGEDFGSHEEYAAAVVHLLDRDAAGSAQGEDDPAKMAFSSLNWSRTLLKQIIAEVGLTDASWHDDLLRTFAPLVEGLSSGPPALRIRQLAALARADVVRFLGPDPVFRADDERGCFEASSPWVAAEPFRARLMLEAMSPPNEVRRNISPLLQSMHDAGLLRSKPMDTRDGAVRMPGAGLDVSAIPYRTIGTDERVQDGVWVLGLQLTSVQWGTAIASEADAPAELGARTLADADRAAEQILD